MRIPIDNPRQINLFIDKCIPKQFNISKKNKDMLELFKKYDIYEDKEEFFNDVAGVNRPYLIRGFGQKDGKFTAPNRLFRECLELEEEEKLIIASKLKNDEWYFIKVQLSWLGLEHTFSEDNLIQNVVDNEEVDSLESYLNSLIGKKLFAEEQQELSNYIISELTNIKDIDYRTKTLKASTVEKILRDDLGLRYAVLSDKETKGVNRNKRYIIISKI